ncbi:LexA family protein [Desulfonatronum thiodismutans]|uniref:LexA family protein n=1 Tax=Desulfonatronum thiodismutans TaxID=159290 RepID=UPI0009FBF71A|nr:translesion error-prone DNA polymerase V autoproteolytic subunit [Desulfonatronum thiodismutans]
MSHHEHTHFDQIRQIPLSKELSLISGVAKGLDVELPLYLSPVTAGFPSPADDFLEKRLDLNDYLVKNPVATYLVRASGDSMQGAGIHDGDILVVDKSVEATDGKVVIAIVYGEFTVKTLRKRNGKACLVPANAEYPVVELTPEMDCEVWGVVTSVIRKMP